LYEYALTAVAVRVNHMNGSLQDAALLGAIFNLEACGLEVGAWLVGLRTYASCYASSLVEYSWL
jgi:hypothetical protein